MYGFSPLAAKSAADAGKRRIGHRTGWKKYARTRIRKNPPSGVNNAPQLLTNCIRSMK